MNEAKQRALAVCETALENMTRQAGDNQTKLRVIDFIRQQLVRMRSSTPAAQPKKHNSPDH